MQRRILKPVFLLLLAVMLCGSGCCAQWHCLPDDCADLLYQCELARAVRGVCSSEPCVTCGTTVDCGCGVQVYEDVVVLAEPEPQYIAEDLPRCPRVLPGPPPVPYQPPMPSKFLPVPTQSVFSKVSMHAPAVPGVVEADFGPQLMFPGNN